MIYSVAAAATEVLKPKYILYRRRNPLLVKKLAGTELRNLKPEIETAPCVSVSREINDIEKSHIYYYVEMVNFPNDIYVIRSYIGIIVLLYQVGKTSCPR